MKNIAVICYNIRDFSKNTVSYSRYVYLCKSFNVYLMSQTYSSPETEKLAKQVRHCPGRTLYLDRIIFPLWVMISVCLIRRKERIDFVYTPYHNLALIAGFLLKKLGLKWIADIYDDPEKTVNDLEYSQFSILKYYFFRLIYLIAKPCLKYADLIICAMVPKVLEKYNINNSKILPITNGVDIKLTQNSKKSSKQDTFRIIYVGEINQARGLDIVISAMAYLKEKIINFRCTLVGDADAKLIKSINTLGLSEYIVVTGMVDHEKSLHYISESNVCLCPLRKKGDYPYTYPVKIFEYMALGKAIVATDLPGIRKIIQNGRNGLLVKNDNARAMAEAILELYYNKNILENIAENNLVDIIKYDWQNINKKIYDELMSFYSTCYS